MAANPQTAAAPAPAHAPRLGDLVRTRVTLPDGARTTVYVAGYDADLVEPRLAILPRPAPLATWCAQRGVSDAIVGGFFIRAGGMPLGELRTAGIRRRSVAFDAPWDAVRSCVQLAGGGLTIARRDELAPEPSGDLLQVGPLLVREGRRALRSGSDEEGFSAAAGQFDSDITAGRYPRAALAMAPGRLLAVACDGRSRHDAGLTLVELADLLVGLGAQSAINLDGGGSTSLVCGGRLQNRPRADFDEPLPGGRPVSTALLFTPRR